MAQVFKSTGTTVEEPYQRKSNGTDVQRQTSKQAHADLNDLLNLCVQNLGGGLHSLMSFFVHTKIKHFHIQKLADLKTSTLSGMQIHGAQL